MSTVIRPEVSKKNQYWIERHRYYELKHFCLQYPIWKKMYEATDGFMTIPAGEEKVQSLDRSDPTFQAVVKREQFRNYLRLVEYVAHETDKVMGDYILMAVTKGLTYNALKMRHNIPCGKDYYYNLYRRFFWILDQARN